MTGEARKYVEEHEGDYYVTGSRVLLDSIVYGFLDGQSPEAIAESFPTLSLEEVYGAIAFYLGHQPEIDDYLRQREADFEARREAARAADPLLYRRLAEGRREPVSR